jgi:hypothetical protein
MAGTSKGQDVTQVQQGPGDLWVITTAPDDATQRLTLATDGSPDSVTNPATHLGAIEGAITTVVKPKLEMIKVDQADGPVDAYCTEIDAKVEVTLMQATAAKLQRILGVGTYSTGSGYKQFTFGGTTTVPNACIAAISALRGALTKFVYVLLYKAVSLSGFSIQFGRAKPAVYKATFAGLSDLGLPRAAGAQIGVLVKNLIAPAATNLATRDLTIAEIQQGPANLWIVGTPPVDATPRLTLAADLTPDATAHPSSVGLGFTEGPVTVTLTPKLEAIKCDQADAPVDYYCAELAAKLEATLNQASFDKLTQALGLGTGAYSIEAGQTPSYEQISFGGLGVGSTAEVCVAAIAPKRTDATKVFVACLFKVISADGISFVMSRAKPATYKVTFEGLATVTRTAGKQTGIFYETV